MYNSHPSLPPPPSLIPSLPPLPPLCPLPPPSIIPSLPPSYLPPSLPHKLWNFYKYVSLVASTNAECMYILRCAGMLREASIYDIYADRQIENSQQDGERVR